MVFIQAHHNTIFLMPPSLEEWLPEGHLARFVVEIVHKLDLSEIYNEYSGNGSPAYPPHIMVALLFYGYATGVFSSRKLERGTYNSVALRFVAANTHPDHDTIATFRKRFLQQLGFLFQQILILANQMDVLHLGSVCLDGTKVKANASKHKALSYEHACKIEKQLRDEVRRLLEAAKQADAEDLPDELSLPEELSRREKRLAAIDKAKNEIERRAAERAAEEQRDYEEQMAKRAEQEQKTGRKPRGKGPTPPASGEPGPKDQVNLTDEESRIMPVSGGGFEQCYNSQAAVDTKTMLIVSQHVTQHTNDKLELLPCLENLAHLPETLGVAKQLIADAGYYSEANIKGCEMHNVEPFLAAGRERHHIDFFERFSEPSPLPPEADAGTKMRHKLRTRSGRAIYALRKQVAEPVFGIIKEVMGFRRFLLRGLRSVQGEWSLVCMAFNLKRLHQLTKPGNGKEKGPQGSASQVNESSLHAYWLTFLFFFQLGWLFRTLELKDCPTGS
jgi:transposase